MTTRVQWSAWLLVAAFSGCASLPTDVTRIESSAYSTPLATTLGRVSGEAAATHTALSGFRILDSGRDAFRERLALIESAERSIDLQYYIWNSDVTGRYLAQRVLTAADRGVRVRILLDDINVGGRDAVLAALDAHPLIEIRIYNPLPRGTVRRWFGIVGNFAKINRRMHNKSLSVDGAATIIGGRNIGDEYFDASPELNFSDRDLLAVGPVVEQMGRGFDAFWNSKWAQPIAAIAPTKITSSGLQQRSSRATAAAATLSELGYELPRDAAQGMLNVEATLPQLIWASARLVIDGPPATSDSSTAQPVALALRELASAAQSEVLIESAYLIAGDPALDLIKQLHSRGVRQQALTNSLASNDLSTNHSGYARRREQMLRSGLELYELRPDAASCDAITAQSCARGAAFSLHSKSVVFDRRTVYVGSFNLNLRSAYLNSETALIIESPELAQQIAAAIEDHMRPENSWHVTFDAKDRLQWQTVRDGHTQVSTHEPETGFWRRFVVGFYRLLPMEKYL